MEPPADVALLLAFVNTADIESGTDELAGPAELAGWLTQRDLLADGTRASGDDLALARELREGLRDAVEVHGDGSPATDRLEAALARLPVVLDGTFRARPAPGLPLVRTALAQLVCTVVEARADGTLDRVKVCARDTCRWAFWDASRNRSHTWCSMRVCGNREKMRRRAQRVPE